MLETKVISLRYSHHLAYHTTLRFILSIQPTIFTGTKPDMKIVREEIFGPVAVVIKFEDEEDVVHQANDTLYGLAAAVFTKDISRALKTVQRLKAGTVWVNCVNVSEINVPFGGFKQSGSTYCFLISVTTTALNSVNIF